MAETTREYQFREGARISGIAPAVVGAELERIREQEGRLTTAAVVEAARPKGAVLNPVIFRFGRDRAAEEFYRIEARRLIRSVVVIERTNGDVSPPRSLFVHIPRQPDDEDEAAGRYEPVDVVIQRADLFEEALRALQSKLNAAEAAVNDLRRAAEAGGDPDRLAQIAIVVAGFGAVRAAIEVLR